jgi:RHS repeat-associated protein
MKRLAGCLLLLLCPAAAAFAAGPPSTLPAGMGKYIMVLWPPGTPVPGEGPVVTMKNVPEPDIEQRGGKLLAKFENRRLIQLPLAAAAELRRHEAVAFLQRVWTGESLEGWDERYVPPPPPAKGHMHVAPQDDANLTWGPKSYTYDGSGNIKTVGSDSFAYDSAGRLIQATVNSTAGGTKSESYKYDAFGNLIEKAVSGTNPVAIPVDPGSNRVQGVSYDPAGNATTSKDARWTYKYDSLNMMTGVKATPCCVNRRMIYDASDERIGTFLINDNPVRWTFRDFEGRIIRDYTSVKSGLEFGMWTWEQDYFYGESGLIGGETQDWGYTDAYRYGGRRHYHLDHLGNVRMVTTEATATTRARSIAENDYYPFGTTMTRTYQEQVNWGDPHIDAMRFAGHWRDFLGLLNVDNTDYIDYMHARYYDPNGGRFLSVDPKGHYRPTAAPQEWNRYSYGLNNPLKFIDTNGLENTLYIVNLYAKRETGGVNLGRVESSGGRYKVKVVAPYGGSTSQVIATKKQMDSTDHMLVVHHSAPMNGEGIIGASVETKDGKNSYVGTDHMSGSQIAAKIAGTEGTSVFIGCDSKEFAQTVANATGEEAAGTVHGVDTVQATNAAAAYATTYAQTGSTDAALDSANQQLTKTVCDSSGKNCGVGQLETVEPKPPEQ